MTNAQRNARSVEDTLSSAALSNETPATQPEDCRPCNTRQCIVTLGIAAFAKTALLVTIAKAHFHFLMKKNLGATAT